ncbi:MAG: hypothetical protein ACYCXN_03090 [Acidimicrobiales bacterium]
MLDRDIAGHATVIGLPPQPTLRGAEAVAWNFIYRFGPEAEVELEPFFVEGRPTLIARQEGQVVAVVCLDEHQGRVVHLEAIACANWPKPR